MSGLVIVVGPPCSGKTTYIRAHAGDLPVFDPEPTLEPDVAAIRAARSAFIRAHDEGYVSACRMFDVGKEHETVMLDVTVDECLAHLEASDREDKDRWADVIRGFYGEARDMPFREEREYRYFPATAFAPVEDKRGYTVEGYATTWDDPYQMSMDGLMEKVDRHALDGADMSDVIVQYDHSGMVLARQRNGTLEAHPDDHGYHVLMYLGGCQQGRDLFEAIQNGLVTQMSWGFSVPDDGWEYDPATRTSTITKIQKVYDVSAVSIPANPSTDIHVRGYLGGVVEAERREAANRAEMERRARLALLLKVRQEGR